MNKFVIFLILFLSIINLSIEFDSKRLNFEENNKIKNTKILKNEENEYNNELCDFHLNKIIQEFGETWTLELFDSWGKIPTGLLWGHFADIGNFDECMNLTKTFENSTDLKGQYCLAKIPLNNISSPLQNSMKNFQRNEAIHPALRIVPSPEDFTTLSLRIGVCIPNSCNPTYIQDAVQDIINNQTNLNITFTKTLLSEKECVKDSDFKIQTIDIIAIVIFTLIGFIILLSTIYDYLAENNGKDKNQLFIAFSVLTNGKKLFKINKRSTSPDVIDCLNGIRFLSIIWVIFGHVHMGVYIPTLNAKYIFVNWIRSLYSMLIQSATVSVDSFFLLSGLLVAWVVLKQLDKSHGKLNIPLMYFHRYLRLTPVLAMSLLFAVSLMRYCGYGPFWKNSIAGFVTTSCDKYWWSTLIYIQNYVNPDQMCIAHSWYLSVDTQLYLISPLILLPLWKWGKKFIIVPIILAIASISTSFIIFYNHKFPLLLANDLNPGQERMTLTYYTTHTRIAPWIVGILLGYYLHLNRNKAIRVPRFAVIFGWIGSFIVMAAILFGYYNRLPPNPPAPPIEAAFYESCSRVSWAIALAWIIFACHKGYGGIINKFLTLPIWQPLSRLTYSVYITHMFILFIIFANYKTDYYFSNFDAIVSFYSVFGITLVVSTITVLAFESPIIGLEKCIFKNDKKSNSVKVNSSSQDQLCTDDNNKMNGVQHE